MAAGDALNSPLARVIRNSRPAKKLQSAEDIELGRHEESLQEAVEAQGLGYEPSASLKMIAAIHLAEGNTKRAAESYQKLNEQFAEHRAWAIHQLAHCAELEGDYERKRQLLPQILRADPKYASKSERRRKGVRHGRIRFRRNARGE